MKKYQWQRMWARKFSPYLSSTFMMVLHKRNGLDLSKNKLFVPEGNLYAIYFEKKEIEKIIANYTRILLKQDLKRYARWYESQFKQFLAWSRKVTSQDFSRRSNSQLADIVSELTQRLIDFSEFQFYAFLVLEGPSKKIEHDYVARPEVIRAITTPYKFTQIALARRELLRLAQSGKVTSSKIKQYLHAYEWLPVYDFTDGPLSVSDLKKEISLIKYPIKELEMMGQHRKRELQEYARFMLTVKNARQRKLIEIVHIFSYLKEMRDDYRRHAYYLWSPLWREISQRLSMTVEEANCLIEKEIVDALVLGTSYATVAKKRKQKFALWYKEGELRVYDGRGAEIVAKKVVSKKISTIIQGVCASPGTVRGRVSKIYHRGEFKKFRSGDILVTTMTHPEFIVVMKKSSAIITDEGGITCHAAIVSRELGKPCIIGTGNGTRVLKDGDLVEVDANRGVVRIVKKT